VYRSLLLVLIAVGGCTNSTAPVDLPDGPPTLAGPIVARDLQLGSLNGRPNIHVRPTDDEYGIAFAIEERTTIAVVGGSGHLRQGALDDLVVGRTVRVWAPGIVLDSCPGQAAAEAVELLE
jgi:hypothetical protein